MRKLLILTAALRLVLGSGVQGQSRLPYTHSMKKPYIGNIHEALKKP